jgi:hypothetical protein
MAVATRALLSALDEEIATKERQLVEAKRAAEQIVVLTNDVVSLKRARQILAGDDSQSMQQLVAEVNAPLPPITNGNGDGQVQVKEGTKPISIGAAVISALRTANKPVKAVDLLPQVRLATHKPDLTYHTMSAVLSVYLRTKKICRTDVGIYTLPKEETAPA